MEQMTVNSVLSLFPETKSEINLFVQKAVESVLNGYENPLKLQVQISALEQVLKGIKDNENFKTSVLNEAGKYGQKTFNEFKSQIQIKETGVKYDYMMSNHPQYNRLCEQLAKLTEQKKEFEKYLQVINGEIQFIDPETGEECIILPAIKTSTTSVVITLNK